MLKEIVNRFRGQTWIRVETPFPERILNLCSARGLAFWDLAWESETAFTCRLSRRDCGRLRRALKGLDCSMTVVRGEGVPFFLGRFRHRQVLLVGLTACALWVTVGSFFIWDLPWRATRPSRRRRSSGLWRKMAWVWGLGPGPGYGGSAQPCAAGDPGTVLAHGQRLRLPGHGPGAGAVPAPELVSKRQPSNVVARRAGLVLKVQALDGAACVLPGTSVTQGQILISGVEDTETFAPGSYRDGTVEARTWYTLTADLPLTAR